MSWAFILKSMTPPGPPIPETLETKEQVEIRHLQVGVLSEQERMKARRFYAPAFFGLSCLWLVIVTGLVFCSGFSVRGFHVSDHVLIAVVTTTTANIIGTLLVVAKYLFPGSRL
jgi:hypothetical protein